MSSPLSIFTYNVLFPQLINKHNREYSTELGYSLQENGKIRENSDMRLPNIKANINNMGADIICLQEVDSRFYGEFRNEFESEYQFSDLAIHCGSGVPHGVTILWKKNRLELMRCREEKTYLGRDKYRAFLLVDLKDLAVQKIVRVACCHLYHPSTSKPPLRHIRAVMQHLDSNPEEKVDLAILAGDLNSDDQYLPSFNQLFDDRRYIAIHDREPTEYKRDSSNFNDCASVVSTGKKLDWILFKAIKDLRLDSQPLQRDFALNASDHRPVGAQIIWKS